MNSNPPATTTPNARPKAKPECTKFEAIGKIRFQRQAGWINHAESLTFLHLFHAGGHLDSFSFFSRSS
jgi:hypothetical protein